MDTIDIADLTRHDTSDGVEQQVVGAVIESDNRILLLRRPIDDFRGGTWELPSGKVETGEDLLTTLAREVTEETGLTIAEITRYMGSFDYLSGSGQHSRQHTWSVTVAQASEVHLTEHDAHAWATAGDDYAVSDEVKTLIDMHFHTHT